MSDISVTIGPPDVVSVTIGPPDVVNVTIGAEQGPAGPPGLSADGFSARFSFGDATPRLLLTLAPGDRIINARLDVYIAFNGAGAALSIGTLADPHLVLPSTYVDPGIAATFESAPDRLFAAGGPVHLFITPGSGASAGDGEIFIQLSSL